MTEHEPRATVSEAIAAWEERGPTSLTVALMAEALYDIRERLNELADAWDSRYGWHAEAFQHSMTLHEASGAVRWILRHPTSVNGGPAA